MPQAESHARIRELLRRQTAVAGELDQALEAEREALAAKDLGQITELAGRKQQLVTSLESLDKAFRKECEQAGIPLDGGGLADYCAVNKLDELGQAWQNLQVVLQECRTKNQVNGGAIEMSRRFAEQVLDVLHRPGDSVNTYGADGKATRTGFGVSVGRV